MLGAGWTYRPGSERRRRRGRRLVVVPEDAQRSEDGRYWWDGAQWHAVEAGGAAGEYSQDGRYVWDGSRWQPAAALIDLSQFPTLLGMVQAGDLDTWLRSIGVDPHAAPAVS